MFTSTGSVGVSPCSSETIARAQTLAWLFALKPDFGIAPADLADSIKSELLGMAESLLDHAGHSSQFKGRIYGILLGHMRIKFLDGASMGLAERHHLEAARRMLPQVEEKIKSIPGLIEGMVKYGDK